MRLIWSVSTSIHVEIVAEHLFDYMFEKDSWHMHAIISPNVVLYASIYFEALTK